MSSVFTNEEIEAMSAEIDRQLREIGETETGFDSSSVKGVTKRTKKLPEKQAKAIQDASKQEPMTFLQKVKKAVRKDLCEKGGVSHDLFKKWGRLKNKEMLIIFCPILADMGFSGSHLQILAVTLVVYVIYIGVDAFCMET